ncbi:DNA-3-methyladenine glycosylase 2 [Hamadaea tsunoensis]|uniref:DNA-3-methyladenine glycosylase 2 n=1 Tax=Hamadaea tsunoensis TaxID=53368 RepID=UPI00040F7583|nr:DNA-3-methyladenine glycosylase 2 [Hamadaea tsunoensis]
MDLYPAISGRDRRFDGTFWFGVTSTGVFCRPSCPARTPKPQNVRFFPSPAAATRAGFRACRRCLPNAVPGSPQWDLRADVTARSMRLIADGVVDREGVPGLANRVGYSERQLNRLLTTELGAGPLALARTQRAQTARTLIESTSLGLAQIAFAAGFGSVRQFNETMLEVYGCPPSQLRRPVSPAAGEIRLKLAYRAPIDLPHLLRFLADRAITGVEEFDGATYRRTLLLPHGRASLAVADGDGHVAATLSLADARDLAPAVARLRRLLDLDADPQAVATALGPHFPAAAGVRVPHVIDGFEAAVRAVVGQQISVAGARTVLAKLCADGLFPTPEQLLALPDEAFAMPTRRRQTLRDLAGASLDLSPGADRATTRAALLEIPGIGPWTADYVLMRALGDPDVLLPTDLGTRHGAQALGLPTDPEELLAYAERWRPWRSYAQMHLWRAAAAA